MNSNEKLAGIKLVCRRAIFQLHYFTMGLTKASHSSIFGHTQTTLVFGGHGKGIHS
jgi:hypothetical protein